MNAAQKEYKSRHDWAGKVFLRELCKRLNFRSRKQENSWECIRLYISERMLGDDMWYEKKEEKDSPALERGLMHWYDD